MTIIQYMAKIARAAKNPDVASMSFDERQDVLDAANAATNDLYEKSPTFLREITEGFMFAAPTTIPLNVTFGSTSVGQGTFAESMLGCSIVIPGDPGWNQIQSDGTLQNPYVGPTASAVVATVYGDAVFSTRYPFDRILSNPQYADRRFASMLSRGLSRISDNGERRIFENAVGRPRYWWVQQLGVSQGNQPSLVIRVSPAPDQAYAIKIRMAYWAKRMYPSDYDAGTVVTIPDNLLESVLVPIAKRFLITTPTFNKEMKDDVLDAAQRADASAAKQNPQPAQQPVFLGTPPTY